MPRLWRSMLQRTETEMSDVPFAVTTPIRVAKVGLKAKDAESLAAYYQDIVGLREMARRGSIIVLGAGDRELLEIEQFSAARPDDPRSAGLYHTAFLLPSRGDLARWSRQAIDRHLPISGASDHLVSEAIYLTDPEGNGIEIYADRPQDAWQWNGSEITMSTRQLNVPDLLGELERDTRAWGGAPANTVIGHVHLRVGNAAEAESWWHRELGLDTVHTYGDKAVFLSTGGYHHHIGANSWQSPRAGKRDRDRTGLAWIELEDTRGGTSKSFEDPWGTAIRTVAA
ncbi:VOC family protein [Phyllobacterium salinisoli]|uniref:VOC family protein n=1 Tax=Phyllobacterium salinisoli TaxID=1899321 RepID=A0A368K593_9HYPH|nr:VOC family protein [Phyllobacterium salinisoli]